MKKIKLAIISIIVLALSGGIIRYTLRADDIEAAKVIANVNGEDITLKDLFNTITTIPQDELIKLWQQGDGSSRLLEQLILDTLLLQEAKRRQLDKSPDIQQKLENYRRELLITAVIKEELEKIKLDKKSTLIAREAKKRPAAWARHIAVKEPLVAQQALARLQAGEDFSKVAQELSIGTDRTKGGELGWVIQGEPLSTIGYEPKVEAALFALGEGEISGLIKTRTRIHIVKVEKKGVEGEEFNGQIAMSQNNRNNEASISQHINQYITKLRNDAKITIYSENMPKITFGLPSTPGTDELLESEIE